MIKRLSSFVFGEPIRTALPERVVSRIVNQQAQSEKLISWVQLMLVVIFGTLWAVAPKTAQNPDFNLVPWALAFYFTFTLMRLIVAYRQSLTRGILMASVVIDIGLLMVLIWSFHIQYEQPASFYLKAPTLMYVFIFIALRALRFEPGFIILAGCSAAVGWTLLMVFVLVAEGAEPMLTRDYVTYMTSNSILIGAEVDKIVSILLVTVVLAIGVVRAQRVLYRAIIESTAAKDLSRFISREVAERIVTSESVIEAGDGESKVATIMFTDIEGFSTISEQMTPGELAKTLNEYFGQLGKVIEKYGGVINQFEGDAMLITFNAVTPRKDHAVAALKTAIEIQEIVRSRTFGHGTRLMTRCGLNTGEIIIGAVGSKDRLTYTVHGDSVNIAARLEQLNKEYGTYVMATDDTMEAAGPGFDAGAVGNVTVRGREKETCVYAVEGYAAGAS